MILIYVTTTAMFFYGWLFVYYIYIANQTIRNHRSRSMYYTTAIIPLIPLTLYGVNLIQYELNGTPVNADYLTLYFIEWCFTTPLFIINLTRIISIHLSQQLVLSFLAFLMNLIGFASHASKTMPTKLQLYGVACSLFVGLGGRLILLYTRQKKSIYIANQYTRSLISVFKVLVRFILLSWSCYPVVFIVYELGYLNHTQIAVAFTCLDFLSKGVFTSILIGYQEHTHRRNSITARFVQRIARVVPIQTETMVSTEQTITVISLPPEYIFTELPIPNQPSA